MSEGEHLVTVEQGKLKGKTALDYHGGEFISFLGIPYAKAPIGELRFRAPQPADPWTGVLDATKDGSPCPALDMYFNYYVGNEDDCLNLNVHTKELPSDKNTKLKPVMVWIHGGAFLYGSNLNELFGPDYLMSEDIVMVSINYRLGILGFLSMQDTSLKIPGNAGLKDMVLALKWVQKNIEQFGGDPNNVTIFGESAGSAAVHYLVLSPLAKGLFHKAIAQSGTALNPWGRGKHNAAEVAKGMGYNNLTDEKKILEKLQKEPVKAIVNAGLKIEDAFVPSCVRPFAPVVETPIPDEPAFLSEEPAILLKEGRFNKVPMIMGYTSKEGMLFEIVRKTRSYVKLTKNMELEVPLDLNITKGSDQSKEIAKKLREFYFDDQEINEESINTLYTLKSDNQFVHGIYKSIIAQSEHSTEPIYVYRMSLESSLNYFKRFCDVKHLKTLFLCMFLSRMSGNYSGIKKIFQSMGNMIPSRQILEGVSHADDLGYLFTNFLSNKIVLGSSEDVYIQRFVRMWTNFAKCGCPIPEMDEVLDVAWKPTDVRNGFDILDIGEKLCWKEIPEKKRMEFWNALYSQYANN